MADAEFTAELVEKISGPAKKAAAGLNQLLRAIKKTDGAMNKASGASKKWNAGVRKSVALRKQMAKWQGKTTAATKGFGQGISLSTFGLGKFASIAGLAGVAGGALVGILGTIKDAALAAAAAAARMAVGFGKAIISTAAWAQTAERGLATAQRGLGGTAEDIQSLGRFASELNLPIRDVVQSFKSLTAQGFGRSEAKEIIAMTADMKALGLATDQQAQIVVANIRKIRSQGRVQGDEILSLAEAGVDLGKVYAEIGKQIGVSADEVQKLISAGKVNDKVAVAAIKTVIKNKLQIEKFGDAAKAASGDLNSMWTKLKNQADLTLIGIAKKVTPKLTKAFDTIGKAIGKALDSPEGQAAIGFIVDAIGTISDFIVSAIPVIEDFGKSFIEGFKPAIPALEAAADAIADIMGSSADANNVKSLGKALGFVAGEVAKIVAAGMLLGAILGNFVGGEINKVVGVFEGIGAAADFVNDAFNNLTDSAGAVTSAISNISISGAMETITGQATSLGMGIIDGIVAGIKAGASAVAGAITGVASSAISAGKSALGIASPSKEFAALGKLSMAGFQQGIEGEGAKISSSVAAQLNPSSFSGHTFQQNRMSVRAPVSMTINAAEDPEATAAAVKNLLVNELGDTFEQMAIQIGVVGAT